MPNVGKAAKRHPSSLLLVRLPPNPSSNISVNIINISDETVNISPSRIQYINTAIITGSPSSHADFRYFVAPESACLDRHPPYSSPVPDFHSALPAPSPEVSHWCCCLPRTSSSTDSIPSVRHPPYYHTGTFLAPSFSPGLAASRGAAPATCTALRFALRSQSLHYAGLTYIPWQER